jgi:hypothetical protein
MFTTGKLEDLVGEKAPTIFMENGRVEELEGGNGGLGFEVTLPYLNRGATFCER